MPAPGGTPSGAGTAALEAAAEALRAGGIVAVPTDTVYGVAALADSPEGCGALFRLKGRPPTVALPVLVADLEGALALAAAGARGRLAAVGRAWWPGPLTLVVEAARRMPHLGGDGTTVGVRCPRAGPCWSSSWAAARGDLRGVCLGRGRCALGPRGAAVASRRALWACVRCARPLRWSDLDGLLELADGPAPCQISIPVPAGRTRPPEERRRDYGTPPGASGRPTRDVATDAP